MNIKQISLEIADLMFVDMDIHYTQLEDAGIERYKLAEKVNKLIVEYEQDRNKETEDLLESISEIIKET